MRTFESICRDAADALNGKGWGIAPPAGLPRFESPAEEERQIRDERVKEFKKLADRKQPLFGDDDDE